jgi:hypothetical protein
VRAGRRRVIAGVDQEVAVGGEATARGGAEDDLDAVRAADGAGRILQNSGPAEVGSEALGVRRIEAEAVGGAGRGLGGGRREVRDLEASGVVGDAVHAQRDPQVPAALCATDQRQRGALLERLETPGASPHLKRRWRFGRGGVIACSQNARK